MKITANCMVYVPIPGSTLLQGKAVLVPVEADRVLKGYSNCGYRFGLTEESLKKLAALKASGHIDWADETPHLWKKDHQTLRIPVLGPNQQARIVDGKCGPAEKAVWPDEGADLRVLAAKQANLEA